MRDPYALPRAGGGSLADMLLLPVLLLVLLVLAPATALTAGPDLECKIHVLAVEFAKQIQPERDLSAVRICSFSSLCKRSEHWCCTAAAL